MVSKTRSSSSSTHLSFGKNVQSRQNSSTVENSAIGRIMCPHFSPSILSLCARSSHRTHDVFKAWPSATPAAAELDAAAMVALG